MLDFKFIKLMGVIFTPEFAIGNKLLIADIFQDISGGKFDGELISMPIPQNAPSEIPRIILNSQDGTWKLEVSLESTNIIFFKPLNLSVPVPNINEFGEFVKDLFKAYKLKTKIKVQRLAFITERYCEIKDITPSEFIAARYCKEEYLKNIFHNPDAIELHALKKYQYEEFNINSWVRVKSSNLADDAKTPILLLINDINTFSEPIVTYSESDIERFFNLIPEHLEAIIKLYF
jgi:hypothetical protein